MNVGSKSKGVRKGVYKCALRGLDAALQDQGMRVALQKAQAASILKVRDLPTDGALFCLSSCHHTCWAQQHGGQNGLVSVFGK